MYIFYFYLITTSIGLIVLLYLNCRKVIEAKNSSKVDELFVYSK